MSAIDPSMITKGDKVTLSRGISSLTDVVRDVERLPTGATLVSGRGIGGPWAIQEDGTGWLLTGRIPATPFPIGTPGTATVAWGDATKRGRTFRKAHGFIIGLGQFAEPTEDGANAWAAEDWSEFVPDAPHATPSREEVEEAVTIAISDLGPVPNAQIRRAVEAVMSLYGGAA